MTKPVISIIMGSKSDWATMQKAAEVLDNFGVAYEKKVVSAHHTWQVSSATRTSDDDLYATATCFFGMFEHEVRCAVGRDNFLFVGYTETV